MSRRVCAFVLAGCLGLAASAIRSQAQQPDLAVSPKWRSPVAVCATDVVRQEERGFRPLRAVDDGQPIAFEQLPAVLTPDYTGVVRLRRFKVAGDVATVRFKLNDPSAPADDIETWNRVATEVINGRTVSIFEPSWPGDVLGRVLRDTSWGWDYPSLYWGALQMESAAAAAKNVHLRFVSTSLPRANVVRVNDNLQFSSHVVNLRIPGYGDTTIGQDDHNFDLRDVARRFYEHFEDSYDTLAVIPQESYLLSYAAFHRNVRNEIRGINEPIFDRSAEYGSAGRLRGVEHYRSPVYTWNQVSVHELGHQWGSFIDWTRLTGLVRAGHQPEAHDPLWADRESPIGAVLTGTRRVRRNDDRWQIEQTPAPITFAPLMLYAMGALPAERVPEFLLFADQGQFGDGLREPDVGTVVTGNTLSATIFNVIGAYGQREGPTPSEWHRATIVVSREALLTQHEMDYWTFFAQRLEDPARSGVISYDGYASFDVATNRAIDLKQDIRPKALPRISQPFAVDTPVFGRNDWRGVSFDESVPSRYVTGRRVRWSGRITATDRSDFHQVLLRFWRAGGAPSDDIRVWAQVGSGGTFVTETQFQPEHNNRYAMAVYLFWPDAEPQGPRSLVTPIVIGP